MPLIPLNPQEQLARRVKQKRKILRINQTELANLAGTSQTAIARLENARGNHTFDLVQRVVNALELNLTLNFNPAPKPEQTLPNWLKP